MRARALLLVGFLTFAVASGAGAAPLAFTATLSIQIADIPGGYVFGIQPLVATGSGIGNFSGTGGGASLPADVFALDASVPIYPPLLIIDGFGLGAPGQAGPATPPLSPGSNHALAFDGVTGTMPVDASFYLLSFSPTSAVTNALAIPLAVFGVGGSQKFNLTPMLSATVIGNPYQLGMVTVMENFFGDSATLMGTGFDNRTALGAGVLQLVTPTYFDFGGAGTMASIATLTIEVVPEPATLLLFSLGLAALSAAGRRRR